MKKVLISCSTHDASQYIHALKKLNIQPILSSEMENEQEYDGLLLPGGGDISPVFYHRRNRGSQNICISEDIIQLLLFHRFFEQQKPILGICKGMQLINVALGGSLIQVLPTQDMHAWQNGDQYHKTTASTGSILYSLYGSRFTTNSAHHQAVRTLGSGLSATQYASDGTIEGIEYDSRPVLGVQWHPERLCSYQNPPGCVSGMPLLEWFHAQLS